MLSRNSIAFVSKASWDLGVAQSYELKKQIKYVKSCRDINKVRQDLFKQRDMKWNDYIPDTIEVDPETFVVTIDSKPLYLPPSNRVCMGREYSLF